MGRGNSHLFTIIVNGPVNVNDVIDLRPQSLASKRKLHSTPIYLPQTHPVPDKRRYRDVAYVGARRPNTEPYTVASLCHDDLESSGGGDGAEIQGEVHKAIGPLAGPRRVDLRRARLQA